MAAPRRKSQFVTADSQFSPVKVEERVSTSPHKGNLTGNPRLIRDNCAEWYNLRQKWVALTLEGSSVTQQIAAVKLQAVYEKQKYSAQFSCMKPFGAQCFPLNRYEIVASHDNSFVARKLLKSSVEAVAAKRIIKLIIRKLVCSQDNKREDAEIGNQSKKLQTDFPEKLHKLCEQLDKIINKLQKIHDKMSRVNQHFQSLQSLVIYQHTMSAELKETSASFTLQPVFHTWPIHKFYTCCNELLAMHSLELNVKKRIAQTVAHCKDEQVLNFLVSAWTHEAYIDAGAVVKLESMLIESGHRYL